MSFLDALVHRFGDRAQANVPLAPFTTFRVGGPADYLVETESSSDIVDALRLAHRAAVPVTLLGGGSNVLVSDRGVRGLVLHPRRGEIRARSSHEIQADAAITINGLVRWTIGRGLAGLEAWAGTPGTVGGGIHGNAHFRGRLLSEHVTSVGVAARSGEETTLPADAMAFGYDRSRLQSSGEVLLWATFRVGAGDPAVLRETARASLAYRKQTQPLHLPSAGCVFQNPADEEAVPAGIPRSAGALIDRAGLKGSRMGGARISPVHANFFVNEDHATAADVCALIERCRAEVAARFGVRLREEIVYLGEWDQGGLGTRGDPDWGLNPLERTS
jgi:UDP-N-acetylmuramate dehydrogenase